MIMTKAEFEPFIGEKMHLSINGKRVMSVELVTITDRSSAHVDAFSLMFRGSNHPVLGHQTYRLQHPAMGELDLFLGPVSVRHTDGVYYEAVFNQPKK